LPHRPYKVISGGQTGVDRGALDIAIKFGFAYGGHVPKDRLAEDGQIADRYRGLIETDSDDPAERTRANVLNSDATLLISNGELSGGSLVTRELAEGAAKPFLHINLSHEPREAALRRAETWLGSVQPGTLNIAGPRESEEPGIYCLAIDFLDELAKKKVRRLVSPTHLLKKN
jgi:hypothetical protein